MSPGLPTRLASVSRPSWPPVGMAVREMARITAADGHPLAIEHLARPARATGAATVVLCHGFGGNRFNMDLDERHSLAAYLHEEGLDVWLVELRGHGRSKRIPVETWNMDDHVDKDLPALVAAIRDRSGGARIVWLGHSLGGMVAYCLLARHPEYANDFAGLITLASPADVGGPLPRFQQAALSACLRLAGRRPTVRSRAFARLLFSPAARRLGLDRLLWVRWANPENLDPKVLRDTIDVGLEDLSVGTLLQWAASMCSDGLMCMNDRFDYSSCLGQIHVPILLVSGIVDRLSPPGRIVSVWEKVGSDDKRVRVFGRQGFELRAGADPQECHDSVDYGHEDLLLGKAAPAEVFPYIASWLREHAPDS